MITGIDVSHHNGTPDFQKAKNAGISFVYVKATEGKTYRDPLFQPNVFNALKAGLHVGCYHFARPGNNTPEEEAENFVKTISVMKYDLLPVLDLEVASEGMSGEALYKWARTFVNSVKSKTGYNCMLYTGLWFLNKYPALLKLNDLPLWLAAYRAKAPTVSGWNWTMWQFTDNKDVPGVGKCDANYLISLDKITIQGGGSMQPKSKPVVKPQPSVHTVEPDMYDLSYLSDYKLIGIRSSAHPEEMYDKIKWAMEARANCVLLLKRGWDLRHLQKALNEMYPDSK